MNAIDLEGRDPKDRSSNPTLLVLGMHRSGTSAITGSLGYSGAWVGEEAELTIPNVENPQGFWERRDVRELCDRLLLAAGADWWKIADFDPKAIPLATLAEQRRKFKRIVSALNEYATWTVKEPRLCLLLPVLRDYLRNPICIHIYRNPLEVARSLQARDGFSISAGLALWEAYNLHALNASRDLPRILVSHRSLISHPTKTLNALVEKLEEFDLDHPIRPDTELIERFIDPGLYHQKATDEETEDFLLPSQHALWSSLRSGKFLDHHNNASITHATRQQLLDLETAELSISRRQGEAEKLAADLRTRDRTLSELNAGMESRADTIRARDETIDEINARLKERAAAIQAHERTIGELNAGMESRAATIQARDETIDEINARLKERAAAIQAHERTIGELNAGMESRADTIRARDETIDEINARLKERAAAIQVHQRTIGELNAGMESRADTIRARDETIDEINARLKERAAAIQAHERTIGELNAGMESRAATIRARDETIDEINARLKERAAAIQAHQRTIGELNAGMESRADTIRARDETIDEINARLKERAAAIQAHQRTIGELNAGMESRADTIQARDETIDEINARLKERAAAIQAHQRTIGELNAGMESRADTIRARDETIDEINARLRERANTIQAHQRTIGELNAGMESRAATIRARDETIDEINARLKERAATIQANDRTIAELNAGMKSRADTIRARDETIDEINARLESRADTIRARDETIDENNARLESRAATIRARDETIDEINTRLESHADTIRARDETISELDARMLNRAHTIQARDRTIGDLNAGMKSRADTIRARDKTISDLRNSTSWKVTRPLRAVSLGVRWFANDVRRVLGRFSQRDTGRIAPATGPGRIAAEHPASATRAPGDDRESAATDRLADLIGRFGEARRSERTYGTSGKKRAADRSKTKVTVIAWDLGHNPLGRTYLLADVLRNDYDVELIGANFPRFGNEIWKPLRNCSRVTVKRFPGANFPDHFNRMEDIARQIEGDVIIVSKPRLPSLELAILAKLHRNRPVILDVDDHEPGFFRNRRPLSLDEVKTRRHRQDFKCPHDEVWTRYSETLIPLFDQVTVSGEELRKKFGGQVLPHIRDEYDFDPAAYPRDLLRAELGFTPRDKVVLFVGTPRMHKGIARIFAALKNLNRPDYKLVVVGTPADREARRFFSTCSPDEVQVVADTPFRDLPGYLCIGDLICLIQAEDKDVSLYQTPAKFTDGLSMGIPMLASNVPPLVHLANQGLLELLNDTPLDRKIDEIFSHYETFKQKAMQNREVYQREYSYAAHLPRLKSTISRLSGNPSPIPDAFHELIAYHREMFSDSAHLPRVTAEIVVDRRRSAAPAADNVRADGRRLPRIKPATQAGDKLDIVFFWKQNDTGIYGRRQDMLVKYLARDSRIHRIFHFDAPLDLFQSGQAAIRSGQAGRYSHARLVLNQTLGRKLRLKDTNKIRFDTFVHAGNRRLVPRFMKRVLPCEKDYLDYLDRTMQRHNIGLRRTVFWVCPNNFDFPSIADRFQPDLVVADVIDDQRKWPVKPNYRERLHANYQEVLARSDLAFANCRSVFEGMQEFTDNIHLFPNAAEILEEEARHWPKPAELRSMKGPVIGYVGNLDIARIDLDLLSVTATERPDWNLVFIGSMHQNKDLLDLDRFKNVHFLGVRPYEKAIRYIRHFDVAMVPHLDNELTRHMNPLKLYVYFSLHVPVVITPIANAGEFEEFFEIGRTPGEFIERIGHCLDNDTISERLDSIRGLLKTNSWEERVARMLPLIEAQFAGQ